MVIFKLTSGVPFCLICFQSSLLMKIRNKVQYEEFMLSGVQKNYSRYPFVIQFSYIVEDSG